MTEKHIEIDRHFIKENTNKGFASHAVVPSKAISDVFVKGVSSKVFHSILCKLGMVDIYAPP